MIEHDLLHARILIVDDEPASLRLLSTIVTRAGYENVRTTHDPRAVSTLCRTFEPDLLLLDLHMPKLDGHGVLKEIADWTKHALYFPVLVLSADITYEARQRALLEGAMDFVSKPYDVTEVRLRIRNLLRTRFLALASRRSASRSKTASRNARA